MKKKRFDCVEMMHEGQKAVHKRLEGMTLEQNLILEQTLRRNKSASEKI